jgi:hypothetical protein
LSSLSLLWSFVGSQSSPVPLVTHNSGG